MLVSSPSSAELFGAVIMAGGYCGYRDQEDLLQLLVTKQINQQLKKALLGSKRFAIEQVYHVLHARKSFPISLLSLVSFY